MASLSGSFAIQHQEHNRCQVDPGRIISVGKPIGRPWSVATYRSYTIQSAHSWPNWLTFKGLLRSTTSDPPLYDIAVQRWQHSTLRCSCFLPLLTNHRYKNLVMESYYSPCWASCHDRKPCLFQPDTTLDSDIPAARFTIVDRPTYCSTAFQTNLRHIT